MTQKLTNVHADLLKIKQYLVKIGPERRQKQIAQNKLEEAKKLYCQVDSILTQVNQAIERKEFSPSDVKVIQDLTDDIGVIYSQICKLLSKLDSQTQTPTGEQEESDQDNFEDSNTSIENMASAFDIKTAISLLPVLDGTEQVTNQLIDGILLYSSLITENTKCQLIDFVLKTRLSPSAKLRLKGSYANAETLVQDIRKYLLPKKSPVALQTQLFKTNQGRRTIEKYGTELEELFVNLTIAQSEGDSAKYEVLRPLNERIAIKRFADGLSDQRLSTIIASRQFTSLPEAIRSALDEQTMSTQYEQVSHIRHTQNNRGAHTRNFRGHKNNYTHGSFNRTNDINPNQQSLKYNRNNNVFVNSSRRGNYSRGHTHRPRQQVRGGARRQQQQRVYNYAETEFNGRNNDNNNEELEFFRA